MKSLSIIIPVFNEEKVIEEEIHGIAEQLKTAIRPDLVYEIIMVENGSTDRTPEIIRWCQGQFPEIKMLSLSKAAYGNALRAGMLFSKADYVVVFNIDFWDVNFLITALDICETSTYQMIIGSKTMKGALDARPLLRRTITKIFNALLNLMFRYNGTDSHGLKLFSRQNFLPILHQCHTRHELFDTELILRAKIQGLKILEIPVNCQEKRKSTYSIVGRIPRTIRDLLSLFIELRIKA